MPARAPPGSIGLPGGRVEPEVGCHLLGEVGVDLARGCATMRVRIPGLTHLAELEAERADDVLLLDGGERPVEQRRLA